MDIKQLWTQRDRATRAALVVGVVLAVLAVPLPTLVALAVGLAAAAALGYTFPDAAVRVGVLVATPVLAVAFLVGLMRGFTVLVLVIFLASSLVLPVGLSWLGAEMRTGRGSTRD